MQSLRLRQFAHRLQPEIKAAYRVHNTNGPLRYLLMITAERLNSKLAWRRIRRLYCNEGD